MSITRATSALRALSRAAPSRSLAIMPTVKVASDTSALDFPAPSHVSLSSTATELAQQLAAFYEDPDSVIKLSEEQQQLLHADIAKSIKAIPDSGLDENWADVNVQVPAEIRLADNPYFEVHRKARREGKLA